MTSPKNEMISCLHALRGSTTTMTFLSFQTLYCDEIKKMLAIFGAIQGKMRYLARMNQVVRNILNSIVSYY